MEEYFFDIPIYRFSENEFCDRMDRLRKQSTLSQVYGNPDNPFNISSFDRHFAYNWNFNEIVGWFRLYFYYSSLQVDLWLYDHRRKDWKLSIKKKEYVYRDRFVELIPDLSKDSNKITEEIIKYISSSQLNDIQLKSFFVDFTAFEQICSSVDWKYLAYSSNHVDYEVAFAEYKAKKAKIFKIETLLEQINELNSEIQKPAKYEKKTTLLNRKKTRCVEELSNCLAEYNLILQF